MLKTAKVFIWIGIICQFFLIYPIVVGIIALQKLNDARRKEEIQAISILTLLFCNMIGGIIMLTMTDKDLSYNRYFKPTSFAKGQATNQPYVILHKVLCLAILGVVLLSYLFSMIPLINYGDAFIPFILTFVLIVASIIFVVLVFSKRKNNKLCAFISLVIVGLSIAVITLSILHSCGLALIDGSPYDMPDLDILIGCIVCSGIIIIMSGIMFFTLIKDKTGNSSVKVEENSTTTLCYGIEAELEEVKSLFEKGLLNEQDYNLAKQEIIKKYYN